MQFNRGEQIAYAPCHAQIQHGDEGWTWQDSHPDIEFGFVTSQRGDTAFCRYWRKGQPGTLRTVANSEGTPEDCLVRYRSVLDGDVWGCLWAIAGAGRVTSSAPTKENGQMDDAELLVQCPCGCSIYQSDTEPTLFLERCLLHDSAPALLAAASSLLSNTVQGCSLLSNTVQGWPLLEWDDDHKIILYVTAGDVRRARAIIAKAQGE